MSVKHFTTPETTSRFFTDLDLSRLDPKNIPHHLAIMPDGNRRFGRQCLSNYLNGHQHGAERLIDIVEAARDLGVKVLTVFGFSTENWMRSGIEVRTVIQVMERYLQEQQLRMQKDGIRLHTIGNVQRMPESLQKVIKTTKELTEQCAEIDLVLAINYGGRDDIVRATQCIASDCEQGKLASNLITEKTLNSYLDTAQWPDPDLFIRTGADQRISNFLIWQFAYTEVLITEKLWPSFTPHDLLQSIEDYQNRSRRYGR